LTSNHPAVVTVGAILAGRDNNVIPETAELKVNTRWFTEDVRKRIISRIDEINKGIAIAAGVSPEQMPTRVMKGYAMPLADDKALITHVNPSLEVLLGKGKVIDNFPMVWVRKISKRSTTTLRPHCRSC
jgi:metal-dependent amidase/aminoacylase/carboxypeptidase family protein